MNENVSMSLKEMFSVVQVLYAETESDRPGLACFSRVDGSDHLIDIYGNWTEQSSTRPSVDPVRSSTQRFVLAFSYKH